MSDREEDDDAPPPQKPRYEGPFKKAANRRAELAARKDTAHHRSWWLSPWRLYGIGMLGALTLAGFYAMKLTVTPAMIRQSTEEAPPPPLPPQPVVRAYCLALSGSGEATAIEPSPFCTLARPPGCKDGDVLQLTYATNGARPRYAYAATVTTPMLEHTMLAQALPVSGGAADTPLGQWPVKAQKERSSLGVVALFSRDPITEADVAPWFESWRKGVRILERAPELPAALVKKGAELIAFSLCIGK